MTTGHDDDLAPVTFLFGRRGGATAPEGPSQEASPGSPRRPRGGRAGADTDTDTDTGTGIGTGEETDDGSAAEPTAERRRAQLARVSEHWSAPGEVRPSLVATDDGAEGDDAEPEGLDAQRRRAENVSLHALGRRGVSSGEMTRLLRDRDLDETVVADEVARLERVGLLDDVQLARDLVESWQRRKGLGRQALAAELRQRHLAAEAVEAALDEIDADDEQGRADEWARKRAASLRGLDRETAERRLHGYLQRRGYRGDVVRRAVERALPRGGARGGGVRFE